MMQTFSVYCGISEDNEILRILQILTTKLRSIFQFNSRKRKIYLLTEENASINKGD